MRRSKFPNPTSAIPGSRGCHLSRSTRSFLTNAKRSNRINKIRRKIQRAAAHLMILKGIMEKALKQPQNANPAPMGEKMRMGAQKTRQDRFLTKIPRALAKG